MGYEKVLNAALVPAVLYFLISLVSIILTAHYWIIGDWLMGRWVAVPGNPWSSRLDHDDIIVDYTELSTNATIISGCLSLTAAVMAFVAWRKLRGADMDREFMLPKRRLYVVAVFITGFAALGAGLAALITSFTDKGPDQYGCTASSASTRTSGPYTNLLCSREMGACNFFKKWLKGKDKEWTATVACNEAIAVKWLQIVLLGCAVIVMALFGLQAKMRKSSRWRRAGKEPVAGPM